MRSGMPKGMGDSWDALFRFAHAWGPCTLHRSVLACEFRRRLAARTVAGRDARRTRRSEARATGFMEAAMFFRARIGGMNHPEFRVYTVGLGSAVACSA